MEIFTIPLWLVLLIALLAVAIGWKVIKFAVKILLALILILAIFASIDFIWPHISDLISTL